MPTATPQQRMTEEEFLALPDDGVERWLIDGVVREFGGGQVTVRNWLHSAVLAAIASSLKAWRDRQSVPRGIVVAGEAGIRLSRDPNVTVVVDVAYIPPDVMANQSGATTLIEGVPALAVEVLSPSDVVRDINDKVRIYLNAGVELVWVVDPELRTATIHQRGSLPRLVNESDMLDGGTILPGYRVRFGDLFQ